MLVLTRFEGEAIALRMADGTEVLVHFKEIISGDPPRIVAAVDAPKNVTIWRAELLDQLPASEIQQGPRALRPSPGPSTASTRSGSAGTPAIAPSATR